jgi:hypothetical protein
MAVRLTVIVINGQNHSLQHQHLNENARTTSIVSPIHCARSMIHKGRPYRPAMAPRMACRASPSSVLVPLARAGSDRGLVSANLMNHQSSVIRLRPIHQMAAACPESGTSLPIIVAVPTGDAGRAPVGWPSLFSPPLARERQNTKSIGIGSGCAS